jgi:hypothetical protein
MFKCLLLTAFFIAAQQSEKGSDVVTIAGSIDAPEGAAILEPLQVVLLPDRYADLWNSEVQRRLDASWERFKPAFAEKKEYFLEVSRTAYLDAIRFVMARMRRDSPEAAAERVQQSSPEGRFEFKSVPLGQYKVVAFGKVGPREFIWQESIDVNSSVPQFLQLKKRIP